VAQEQKQLLRLALGTGDAGYAGMLVLVLCATALAGLIVWFAPLESVSAIYMLPVLVAAIRYGTGPAIVAALLGAVMTSLFYPPLFSVQVFEPAQIIDLVTSLAVALTLGWLAGHLRAQMFEAREEERRTRQLYRLSSEIAGAGDVAAIYDIVAAHMADLLGREVALFTAADGRSWRGVRAPVAGMPAEELGRAVESFAAGTGDAGGPGVEMLALGPQAHWLLCRLGGPVRPKAVLAVPLGGADAGAADKVVGQARSILAEGEKSLERLGLTRALEERQLRQRSDALRDILIEAVSHELRTPVAGILGSASVLSSAPPVVSEPRLQELSAAIGSEAARLDRRIQSLLDVTRIRAGALQPRFDALDIADIVNAALDSAAERLGGRKVIWGLGRDLPFVRVDPVLVEQALVNILENAAKFASGSAPIAISAGVQDGRLAVDVRDEGPGLDRHEAERIFERFHRGERHADIAGGSGLGLTIAKTFVEANGGSIEPLSQGPGKGTTMRIWLPLAPERRLEEKDDD
jgi:two-component system, OmpR family, sensor histidine kinase KdpD